MQPYGQAFAKVYNTRWAYFSKSVAPKVEALFESVRNQAELPKTMLDVCCGTGQLAGYFLEKGFTVWGIDLSPYMLEFAKSNNQRWLDGGTACFSLNDAASFSVERPVSYVTCLYDAMNHLPSLMAIKSCIKCAFNALEKNGLFLFDVNTRRSLPRWNGITVQEDDELFMLNRGIFDDSMDKAYTQITGFIREDDGRYQRFSETVYNLAVSIDEMKAAISQAGFAENYCTGYEDLLHPAVDQESLQRACFICLKK